MISSVKASPDGWVSPTGFEDPTSHWLNEPNIYDELESNAGQGSPTSVWNDWWIILTLSDTIACSKIRIYSVETRLPPYIFQATEYDIDVFDVDLNDWVHVYQGENEDGYFWCEFDLDIQRNVNKTRVRFRNYQSPVDFSFSEFDFWEVEEAPPEEYSFTFTETLNVSASPCFWKAKMFSESETITVSDGSNVWKEKSFYTTETISVNDAFNIFKAKLFNVAEIVRSSSLSHVEFEVIEQEEEEDEGGSGKGEPTPSKSRLIALFAVIVILIGGYFWISPESQKERKTTRKPKPTTKPRKPVSTLKPRRQKSTTKPRKHKSTTKPRKHEKTTKQRKPKPTTKPRKHRR